MTYIHITKTPGMDRSAYGRVRAHLGEEPIQGQVSHVVGFSDGSLHTVDVWVSREDAVDALSAGCIELAKRFVGPPFTNLAMMLDIASRRVP